MSDNLCVSLQRLLRWVGPRTVKHSPRVTVSSLPDEALLEVFNFYVDQINNMDAWHTLVHVCQKWRYVVFASPRRLHLELRCTNKSPVKKMLDIWPALPIVINALITHSRLSDVINLVAALEHHNLVCRINIRGVLHSLLNSAAMKERFPMLTDLTLFSYEDNAPVISDSFLDGSAPRLQSLEFRGIPFPALRKLLMSATNLVTLLLLDIPNSGIISPNLIVTCLSTLTRLRVLFICFRSPRSRAEREHRHPSLLKHQVLPSLTEFCFKGDSEYLEEIVGRIDAPALDSLMITFFNQLVFDTPLLRDFFSRTEVFREPHRADVTMTVGTNIRLTLFRLEGTMPVLDVTISSRVAEWQLSSLSQFFSSSFPPFPTLERLGIHGYIHHGVSQLWTDDVESSQWLELLHPFVAVRDLVLVSQFQVASRVATALRELTGNTTTAVLPALRQILIDASSIYRIREELAPFITARQLSGHPVSVV